MRRLAAEGVNKVEIARRLGVHRASVYRGLEDAAHAAISAELAELRRASPTKIAASSSTPAVAAPRTADGSADGCPVNRPVPTC